MEYFSSYLLRSRCLDGIKRTRDLLGELPVMDKGRGRERKWGEPPATGLTALKGRVKEGGMGRKGHEAQYSSEKVLARTVGNLPTKVTCWGNPSSWRNRLSSAPATMLSYGLGAHRLGLGASPMVGPEWQQLGPPVTLPVVNHLRSAFSWLSDSLNWMFVSLPNSYVKVLTPILMKFGGRTFGKY